MTNNCTWWNDSTYKAKKEEPEKPRQLEITDNKIQITASIDGTVLAKVISDQAERELVDSLKDYVRKTLYTRYYNTRYSSLDPGLSDLNSWIVDEIKDILKENKDEIIKSAAHELADSMRRSKPVREKFCDELGEELAK